ncbi:MAG: glycoside hydrolase family 2, partial [Tannerella sp.]|nr:glycoside hydrolase family 2 [Tannerella sp.]
MKNDFSPSRRTFLRSGLVLAAGLPAIRMYPFSDAGRDGARPVSTGGDDPLFNLFRQPPTSAKPFVRWWWNGDKVTARELLRELDVLNEAGIGGVEINPIAFPPGDDLAIPSMQWLSPEWIEMVKVTLKGAAERGMICDIIVGSGWPFGAEYLQGDERSQILTRTTRKIQGPGIVEIEIAELLKEAAPRIGYPNKSSTSELYSLCLAPLAMDKFMPPTWLPFDKEQSKVSIQVPEGEHILYALVTCTGFQSVIQGSPGAAGPVLNHLNQVASQKFLDNMADKLFPQIAGLKGFRSMFCDSMELEGANWCNDFLPEFKRRRGYDIKPYL